MALTTGIPWVLRARCCLRAAVSFVPGSLSVIKHQYLNSKDN